MLKHHWPNPIAQATAKCTLLAVTFPYVRWFVAALTAPAATINPPILGRRLDLALSPNDMDSRHGESYILRLTHPVEIVE